MRETVLALLLSSQAGCMVGWQRGQGGVGETPGGLRIAPEGAPAAIAVTHGEKPAVRRLVLVPLPSHDAHRHEACGHPSKVVDQRTLFFYEGRWETQAEDGSWMQAPDEAPPTVSTHPNAPLVSPTAP